MHKIKIDYGGSIEKHSRLFLLCRQFVLLFLLLMSTQTAWADWKEWNSKGFFYTNGYKVDEISPNYPTVEFIYRYKDEYGQWDWLRNATLYVVYNNGSSTLAVMSFDYDKHSCYYGNASATTNDDGNQKGKKIVWTPSESVLNLPNIVGLRLSGTWTYSDKGLNGERESVSRQLSLKRPSLGFSVGSLSRSSDTGLTYSASGLPTSSSRTNKYYFYETSSYTSQVGYGSSSASSSSAKFVLEGGKSFNPKDATTLYVLLKSTGSINGVSSNFEQRLGPISIKGCAYPNTPDVAPNVWGKSVKLTWTNVSSDKDTAGKWHIFRYEGTDKTTRKNLGSVAYSTNTFTDTDKDLEYEKKYTYEVCFGLTAWNVNAPNANLTATATASIDRNFNILLKTEGKSDGVTLKWDHDAYPVGTTFNIKCRKDDASFQNLTQVTVSDKTSTSHTYTHKGIESPCDSYEYYIEADILGKSFMSNKDFGQLEGNSTLISFKTTKGLYATKTRLEWGVKKVGTNQDVSVVSRRLAETKDEFVEIYRTSGNQTNYTYNDDTSLPGKIYEYRVELFTNCDGNLSRSNSLSEGGYSQSTGTFAGRITYGTGTSVENVKINVVKQSESDENVISQFKSMRSNGLNGGFSWPMTAAKSNDLLSKPYSIQMWVNLDADVSLGTSNVVKPVILDIHRRLQVAFEPVDKRYRLVLYSYASYSSTNPTRYTTDIYLESNRFYNLTLVHDKHLLSYYVVNDIDRNDIKIENYNSGSISLKSLWSTQYPDIIIGSDNKKMVNNQFKGYIDDVRVWKKALTKEQILKNYGRALSGTEDGLTAYWTFDEGMSTMAFDISKTNGVMNDNHVKMNAGNTSSDIIPQDYQFGLYTLTDKDGNYILRGVPFVGEGTTYAVIPTLGIHKFQPSQQLREVSPASLVHNGSDFVDISSFPVKGEIYYENTDYPVHGATIKIDGVVASKDGEIITTDELGRFEVSVPIGDHFISIEKHGHTFVNDGRYPEDPQKTGLRHTFDSPLENPLLFYDNTLVTFAGRVAGGEIEKNKPHGLLAGEANIGKAVVEITSGEIFNLNLSTTDERVMPAVTPNVNSTAVIGKKSGSSAKTVTIETDPVTGEFAAKLPPIDFTIKSIKIPSNLDITFDLESYPTIGLANATMEFTDSLVVEQNGVEITNRFTYNLAYDIIYRAGKPIIEVSDKRTACKAFGERTYEYIDVVTNKKEVVDLFTVDKDGNVTYNYNYPCFYQYVPYEFEIEAYEEYINKDGGKNPTAWIYNKTPMKGKVVTITNQFASSQAVYLEDGIVDGNSVTKGSLVELKENQIALDEEGKGDYSFYAGYPNIIAPNTRGLQIVLENNGQMIEWENSGTPFQAVVIGELPTGNNFVTSGPDEILMILRDPPGTNSSAYIESGTTITTSVKNGGSFITQNEISTVTSLGTHRQIISGTPIVGTIDDIGTVMDLEVGININSSYSGAKEWTTQVTNTERISTSDDMIYVGAGGDVFVGAATNIVFGNSRKVGIFKKAGTGFELRTEDVISTGSEYGTAFKYTQLYIENTLIPNLHLLRDALIIPDVPEANYNAKYPNMTDGPIFISTLSKDDPRFGSNNFDKEVWGAEAVGLDRTSGPSYIMVPPSITNNTEKKVLEDKVRWYNSQIGLWENTLAKNEMAKIQAIEDRANWFDKNHSFDAGVILENSTTTCEAETNEHEYDFEMLAVLGLTTGVEINTTGVAVTGKTTTGGRYFGSTTNSDETCITTGYTFQEDGDDDALSVDVFKAPDGFGAIFSTRAGQTSCPYEGEIVSKYYQPGTILSNATMRVEMPVISVENSNAVDIPSGGSAYFTLKLDNISDIKEDVWFKLMLDDESNPNGAILSVDGQSLTGNGRAILVKAGETLTKTLQLKQSRPDVLRYENINIILASECQYDPTSYYDQIADTVAVSAFYVPGCSPITLSIDRRTMNIETGEVLPIVIKDFEASYMSLKAIRLQYKGERDVDWKLMKEYVTNSEDKTINNEYLSDVSKGGRISLNLPMVYPLFYDQKYLFRAITVCQFGSGEEYNETETIEVIKDMSQPKLLGAPTPLNGVLTSDNEVSITFNEIIKSGIISASNFSAKGVLNAYPVEHSTTFKGGNGATTEHSIELNSRDFAIELWLKYDGGKGSIFQQGTSANRFEVNTTSTGKLEIKVGDDSFVSAQSLVTGKWMFLTVSYDYAQTGSKVSASMAYDASTVTLFDEKPVTTHQGNGRVTIGNGFNGSIHEVSLWNKTRAFASAIAEMNTAKHPSTPNIIGYWPLNEGAGNIAQDRARNRHIILNSATDWTLANANAALQLAGNDYLMLQTSKIPVLPSENYVVELWFKGDKQSGNATLFAAKDSLLVLQFVDNKLSLIASGKVYDISKDNYLDNAWHHVAINVLRNGNTAVYLDGKSQTIIHSSLIPALASPYVVIGATRYGEDPNYAFRSFFTGCIDEVRIWKANLTTDMLSLNRMHTLRGNESGLVAYYPFEKTETNAFGQPELVETIQDMFTSSIAGVTPAQDPIVGGSIAYTRQTAPLKVVRPTTSVAFVPVVSDRKVVFNIDEDPARIEGCTIEFTVEDVQDLNGNYSEAASWTVFVNRNQLTWSDQNLSLTKPNGASASISATIMNQSGKTENWTLSNVPAWLSTGKTSGSLPALSNQVINFALATEMPVGKYEATIYLSGNNNIQTPLTIQVLVSGVKVDWQVNPADFEYSMNMVALVKVNGRVSEDADDILGAFIGDQCVGVASPYYMSSYDTYYVMADIYGNANNIGQTVQFKFWDASTGFIHSSITPSRAIAFKKDANEGTFANPIELNANNEIEQTITLNAGWNWVSFNLDAKSNAPQDLFGAIASQTDVIKGKTSYVQSDGTNFVGDMNKVTATDMYKIKMNEAAQLTMTGEPVITAANPINLNNGWNWLGYTPQYNMNINEALAALTPERQDQIKAQSGFAQYSGTQWEGTLKGMTPNQGYLFHSSAEQAKSFAYPQFSIMSVFTNNMLMTKSAVKKASRYESQHHLYSSNMNVTAIVLTDSEQYANMEIGAFDNAGVCRGAAFVQTDGFVYLTIAGDGYNDVLTLKCYNHAEDKEQTVVETINYYDDEIIGEPSNPYPIMLDANSIDNNVVVDAIIVYPRRVETVVNVRSSDSPIKGIQLYNHLGQMIQSHDVDSYFKTIYVNELLSGTYILNVELIDGKVEQFKIVR